MTVVTIIRCTKMMMYHCSIIEEYPCLMDVTDVITIRVLRNS